jgi:hypothetical protein
MTVRTETTPPTASVERMSRATTSTGCIYFWQGGSLWIGRGKGRTEWREHHAHQLVVAPEGAFRFRTQAQGQSCADRTSSSA